MSSKRFFNPNSTRCCGKIKHVNYNSTPTVGIGHRSSARGEGTHKLRIWPTVRAPKSLQQHLDEDTLQHLGECSVRRIVGLKHTAEVACKVDWHYRTREEARDPEVCEEGR